jgi:tetratricopeptide (TPR) repeat protein
MDDRPPSTKTWTDQCEAYLHAGKLSELELLLQGATEPVNTLLVAFYQARLAARRLLFEEAVRDFKAVARESGLAGNSELCLRAKVWEAYCYYCLEHYSVCDELLAQIELRTEPDTETYAEFLLVRALRTADKGSYIESNKAFELAIKHAVLIGNPWLEARASANAAPGCNNLGRFDRSGALIQRVEEINSRGLANPQQLVQIKNTSIHRCRLMGLLPESVQEELPLPEESLDDGAQQFRGWQALSTAMLATDAGEFDFAEQAWALACRLLSDVPDKLSRVELCWERAWILFRKGDIAAAVGFSARALELVNPDLDTETTQVYTVAGVIKREQGNFQAASLDFQEAYNRYHAASYRIGEISVLLQQATLWCAWQRGKEARLALARALHIMRHCRIFGTIQWYPPMMVDLCMLAITEAWDGLEGEIIAELEAAIPHTQEFAHSYDPERDLRDLLGDFAADLAAQRLAREHWQAFKPLLKDERPQVRRRAAKIMDASGDHRARAALDDQARDSGEGPPQRADRMTVCFFGRFEILINDTPLHPAGPSPAKARAVAGLLLLARQRGIHKDHLASFFWPQQPEPRKRRAALQVLIASVNRDLMAVFGGDRPIRLESDSYVFDYNRLDCARLRWDWLELERLAEKSRPLAEPDPGIQAEAASIYHDEFMGGFLQSLETPDDLPPTMQSEWERIYDLFYELYTEREGQARGWKDDIDHAF